MRISGWSIDGFGIFRAWNVRDLAAGLTIVYGPNEAGKTTLLAFIRGVLFGFPDRRTREPRYPPLQGGRHGGRLFLLTSGGEAVVDRDAERRGVRLILPGNWEGNEDDLRALLGRADRNLFRSVFAFTLRELQDFETLTGESVRDRIFSAGISGAGVSARQALAELEGLSQDIERRLRELIPVMNGAHADLAEARARMARYPEVLQDEESCKEQRDQLERRLSDLERELRRVEKLLALWPGWLEAVEARERLAELPVIDRFPSDPIVRLTALSARLAAAREAVAGLTLQQQADEAERDGHKLDDRLAAVTVEAEALRDQVALHRDRLQKLPQSRLGSRQAEEKLVEEMRELGPGWDEAKLRTFDRSIPTREEVRHWGERLRTTAQVLEQTNTRLETAKRARRDAEKQAARLTDQLAGLVEALELDELARREMALRQLRGYLAAQHEEEVKTAVQEALIRDRTQARKVATDQRGWPWQRLLAAGLVLTVLLAGIVVALTHDWQIGVLALPVLAVLVGTVTLWQRRDQKALDGRISWLDQEVSEAESARDQHRAVAQDCRTKVAKEAATIGLPAGPSWEAVEEAAATVERQQRQRTQWESQKSALDSAQELVSVRVEEERECQDRVEDAKTTAQQTSQDWEKWKSEGGLSEALSPDGVLDFFQAVQQARETLARLSALRTQVSDLGEEVESWEKRASQVLGGILERGEDLVIKLLELVGRCQADADARARVVQLSNAIGRRALQIEQAQAQLRSVEKERAELFKEAAAMDEAEFRERYATFVLREQLNESITAAERRLVSELGVGAEADRIRHEIATGKVPEWQAQGIGLAKEIEAVGLQRDNALAEQAKKESERLVLEHSVDVMGQELQWQGVIHDFTEMVRQWQVLALAHALINRTLDDFVRTRQPEVLAQASPVFQTVTCGRYERILQAENGEDVLVMDRAGGTRGIHDLSQGTAEQLYLCIRLALAAEYAKSGVDLPILMDDALVNFDPVRAGAIARALVEYAAARQLLVFTCHPETRDLFLGINPAIPIVELQPIEPVVAPASQASSQESLFEPTAATQLQLEGAGRANGDLQQQILDCLEQRSLAISELVVQTGVDEARVRRTLNVLRDLGKVDLIGQKRGARWQRVETP